MTKYDINEPIVENVFSIHKFICSYAYLNNTTRPFRSSQSNAMLTVIIVIKRRPSEITVC